MTESGRSCALSDLINAESVTPGAQPAFTHVVAPSSPRAVVLVLHGGAEHSDKPVDESSLSWRRAQRLVRKLAPAATNDGLAVALMRYRVKGWNGGVGKAPDPIPDGAWGLTRIAEVTDAPIVLLGHSMGGRTAVAVADHPQVRGVVALAPWFPSGESIRALPGKSLVAAHGRRDRITSARATRDFVDRASEIADARYIDMGPVGHYLLRRERRWNDVALNACKEILAT